MFVSEAHSVTQQSRLAITLAWIAGLTNAVTILSCGFVTSHLSGTTSNLGIEIASQQWGLAALSLFLLVTFCFGAMVAGFTTELARARQWESIYVLPIAIEAILLAAFALGLEFLPPVNLSLLELDHRFFLVGVAAVAMGLQNATITRISSGVVRTTHVTGVVTDLGIEAVQYLWPKSVGGYNPTPRPSGERLLLLISIVGSFAFGAGLGTISYEAFPRYAMFPPVLFLAWIIYQDITKPIAELVPKEGEGAKEIAIFELQPDRDRPQGLQRLPDLRGKFANLNSGVRVVILEILAGVRFNQAAVAELKSLEEELAMQGRTLLLVVGGTEQLALERLFLEAKLSPDLSAALTLAAQILRR
jgi:uncharacterized membrane protein YoaK (UPF0700 family)